MSPAGEPPEWWLMSSRHSIQPEDMDGIFRLTARIGELEREVTELRSLVMVYKPVYESVLKAGREMPELLQAYGLPVDKVLADVTVDATPEGVAFAEGLFDAADVVE